MKALIISFAFILMFQSINATAAQDWDEVEFTSNGNSYKLADFKGKTVLIMFWATWCHYCKSQIPAFSMLKTLYSSVPDFEVLPISIDFEDEQYVNNYLQTYNITNLAAYMDSNSKLLHSMGFSGVPSMVLVSRDGDILGSYSGLQDLDIKYLERVIKKDAPE